MARIEACDAVDCRLEGRNCDPIGKGCDIFKRAGYRLMKEGILICDHCEEVFGSHVGSCPNNSAAR